MPKKVYLCKSYRSSPESINYARDYLKALGLEVLEAPARGKTYTPDNLLSCQAMFVLPPQIVHSPEKQSFGIPHNETIKGEFQVGKGQAREVQTFLDDGNDESDIYIITDLCEGIAVNEFDDITFVDEDEADWSTNFAIIEFKDFDPMDVWNYDVVDNEKINHAAFNDVVRRVNLFLGIEEPITKEDPPAVKPKDNFLIVRRRRSR